MARAEKQPAARSWIGTSGFQYPEWKGGFYPEDLPASKMLGYYAGQFNSTESNYSFRHLPSAKTIERWASGTPEQFVFSFKAPQRVTHFAKLQECGDVMKVFREAILPMGKKLGPVLFQLPPTFRKDAERLRRFLEELPEGLRAAWEFRHASWFDDEILEILRVHGSALCLAESEDLVTPREVTADFGYLRLRRDDYQPAEIVKWAEYLTEQAARWSDAYIYFKHEETGVGPQFAFSLKKLLAAGG